MILKVRGSSTAYIRFLNLSIGYYELTSQADRATVFKSKGEANFNARLWVRERVDAVPLQEDNTD